MNEYDNEKLNEYFEELILDSENPKFPYKVVKYDKDKNILNVIVTLIKDERYSDFLKKLVDLGFKGKINFVSYEDKEEQHNGFDGFLQCLEKYEPEIGIENIILQGNFEFAESEFFKKVQTISLAEFSVGSINKFIDKFPNLKSIEIENYQYDGIENKVDLDSIMTVLKYVPIFNIRTNSSEQEIQEAINQNDDLRGKILILNNGMSFVNLENLKDSSQFITIGFNDLNSKKEILQKLVSQGHDIILSIPDASKLSVEQAEKLRPFIKEVEVFSYDSKDSSGNFKYDLDTYISIREKLDELVECIDPDLPEKERFAEVYYRICNSIVYDHRALSEEAITPEDKKYAEDVHETCRNLENGLLYGKCVCAGYAEILRNALLMLNIENIQVSGSVGDSRHAWNKVKLDGVWYNVDATWDAPDISRGVIPTHCCKSDDFIKNVDGKKYFNGHECTVDLQQKELENLFNKKELNKITLSDYVKKYIKIFGLAISRGIENLKDVFTKKNKMKYLPDIAPQPAKDKNLDKKELEPWSLENFGTTKQEVNQKIKDGKQINNYNKEAIKNDEREDI